MAPSAFACALIASIALTDFERMARRISFADSSPLVLISLVSQGGIWIELMTEMVSMSSPEALADNRFLRRKDGLSTWALCCFKKAFLNLRAKRLAIRPMPWSVTYSAASPATPLVTPVGLWKRMGLLTVPEAMDRIAY